MRSPIIIQTRFLW